MPPNYLYIILHSLLYLPYERSDKVKMIFSSQRFFQKLNERSQLYYNDTSGLFLEEIEVKTPKRHFEIN